MTHTLTQTFTRIYALVYRHAALFRRSWPRLVEMAYWPTLQLLIWGFTAHYLGSLNTLPNHPAIHAAAALIAGVLLWEVTLRGQLALTITFLEEIWSRNLGHLFVSPLRPSELVAGLITLSAIRTLLGLLPAIILAYGLYRFNILNIGPMLPLFFANLMVMGWWVALLIVSLLFRYGAGAESLAWTLAFAITPIACVYYPVTALPFWLQPLAHCLPAAPIFEGMRATLAGHQVDSQALLLATTLNAAWMLLAIAVFAAEFRATRIRGSLISIGE